MLLLSSRYFYWLFVIKGLKVSCWWHVSSTRCFSALLRMWMSLHCVCAVSAGTRSCAVCCGVTAIESLLLITPSQSLLIICSCFWSHTQKSFAWLAERVLFGFSPLTLKVLTMWCESHLNHQWVLAGWVSTRSIPHREYLQRFPLSLPLLPWEGPEPSLSWSVPPFSAVLPFWGFPPS